MPTYQVYYARRPTYFASGQLGTPLLTVPRLRRSHVRVTTIEADSRAEIEWSPDGHLQARDLDSGEIYVPHSPESNAPHQLALF